MQNHRAVLPASIATLALFAGCATSPEAEMRRERLAEDVENILLQPPAEGQGEVSKCISNSEYRSYRVIDERHLLFEGSRNRYWVNTLRGTCNDLRWGEVLVINHLSGSRLCELDRFKVSDWFRFPSASRQPTNWGGGAQCVLGKFQPVTPDQVSEIEAALERN